MCHFRSLSTAFAFAHSNAPNGGLIYIVKGAQITSEIEGKERERRESV